MVAEAYDDDPNKLTDENVLKALVTAGFDAAYDHQSYNLLKSVLAGPKWANDLDGVLGAVAPLHNSVRYAENHDEVRLANSGQWGGWGPSVGKPVSAILFGIGRGPLLLYSGQEVGEPALGIEGFGGDDARTSIFDYWSMPEMVKWVNNGRYDGGQLSPEQKELRAWYGRLVKLCNEPAFRSGEFLGLNRINNQNPRFGRMDGEPASGHWLYAFLRHDGSSGQSFVVVANLNGKETLRDVRIMMTEEALAALGVKTGDAKLEFQDRLSARKPIQTTGESLRKAGLEVPSVPSLTAYYFEKISPR